MLAQPEVQDMVAGMTNPSRPVSARPKKGI